MNTPDWLNQVEPLPTNGDGVGAALAAVGQVLERELRAELPAGEVGGAAVQVPGSGTEYVVYVATGSQAVDIARIAESYGVTTDLVSLCSAAKMLEVQYQGVASCATQW